MSDITLHLQKTPYWLTEFVDRCKGNLKYIVGVGVFPNYPGVKVLGRTYLPDGLSDELVNQGASGADAWIDMFTPVYSVTPHVAYWIGPNEYVLWDQGNVDKFNAFHVRFIERMSALGHQVACGQINTGWPHLRKYGDPPPYPEALAPTLAALWAHEGLFTLHEYWPGLADPTGNILRYRDTMAALIQAGVVNLPNFMVTELGVDVADPLAPQGHWGWQHFMGWPAYFDLLKGYSKEVDKDSYMKGASIFTVADDWVTFQINYDQAMPLADWIGQDTQAVPTRAKLLDVNQFSGTPINWLQVKDDGYTGVLIRVSGPNADRTELIVDKYWEQNYAGAASAGLLIGGYHGLMPDVTGQAKFFVDAVGDRPLELGYYGDLENMLLTDDKCNAFLTATDRNMAEWGVDGVCNVYTNLNFMNNHIGDWAAGRELWIAGWVESYTDSMNPIVPKQFYDWKVWQYTNEGYVAGVPARVCLDVYNGTEEELYEEYAPENGGEVEPMDVKVYDAEGNEKDWEWAIDRYGIYMVEAEPPEGATVYRLAELRQKIGPCGMTLNVRDEQGNPMEGVAVLQGWADGDVLEDDVAPRTSEYTWRQPFDKPNRGSGGMTNADGVYGWGWGAGEQYDPTGAWGEDKKEGAHWYWIMPGDNKVYTDVILGLGWLLGTDHDTLNITFGRSIGDEPEPPEPPAPTGKFKVTGTISVDLIVEAIEDAQ